MPDELMIDPIPAANADVPYRAVVALSSLSVSGDWEHVRHQHRKAQLLYVVRGMVSCEIEEGMWIVPARCALWIPGGVPHSAKGSGETRCYCLFVEPDAQPDLPQRCCTLSMSILLRELIVRAAALSGQQPLQAREERLNATLLDELAEAPIEGLHLPMPHDARLCRLVDGLLTDPADRSTARTWARRIGMSERNMSRLWLEEIGMSLGSWRRQLHIVMALQRLSDGKSVQTVALELGYESASGFVTMFRKTMGQPPIRYLSDRLNVAGTAGAPTIALP